MQLNYRKINPLVRKALIANDYQIVKIYKENEYYIVEIETTNWDFGNKPENITEKYWIQAFSDYLTDAYGIVERCFIEMGIPSYFMPLLFVDWSSKALKDCKMVFDHA
jgi:hypothetical protein